ncbi:hypothetical protein PTSG_00552 [Salpingoeca rosetta]|uniref:PARP catalytic domain-containing protein n=1 Tax=Salpingoeca rosetta (strain ATCC 50818 / BSB-021) TaxID=946362 RepID=F2TWT3_SALR5|nr:uncharacterized protein PTSG_00552 [Salpingoeca rosetta]EGD72529.1 hypothetical protein PTSG_00552 [Salpingoeca rosetta]|eukprot:XP_004999098.1 hypothetical protein PTSG_00552 [Salpingoeca rosetta]
MVNDDRLEPSSAFHDEDSGCHSLQSPPNGRTQDHHALLCLKAAGTATWSDPASCASTARTSSNSSLDDDDDQEDQGVDGNGKDEGKDEGEDDEDAGGKAGRRGNAGGDLGCGSACSGGADSTAAKPLVAKPWSCEQRDSSKLERSRLQETTARTSAPVVSRRTTQPANKNAACASAPVMTSQASRDDARVMAQAPANTTPHATPHNGSAPPSPQQPPHFSSSHPNSSANTTDANQAPVDSTHLMEQRFQPSVQQLQQSSPAPRKPPSVARMMQQQQRLQQQPPQRPQQQQQFPSFTQVPPPRQRVSHNTYPGSNHPPLGPTSAIKGCGSAPSAMPTAAQPQSAVSSLNLTAPSSQSSFSSASLSLSSSTPSTSLHNKPCVPVNAQQQQQQHHHHQQQPSHPSLHALLQLAQARAALGATQPTTPAMQYQQLFATLQRQQQQQQQQRQLQQQQLQQYLQQQNPQALSARTLQFLQQVLLQHQHRQAPQQPQPSKDTAAAPREADPLAQFPVGEEEEVDHWHVCRCEQTLSQPCSLPGIRVRKKMSVLCHVVDVDVASHIVQHFPEHLQVVNMARVQNFELRTRYLTKRERVLRARGLEPLPAPGHDASQQPLELSCVDARVSQLLDTRVERRAFHCTSAPNINSIHAYGLRKECSRVGNFGRGIYMGLEPEKANSYWKPRVNMACSKTAPEMRFMLVLRVIPGRVYPVPAQHNMPYLEGPPPGYDGVLGTVRGGHELVVYENDRVIVDYIVGYRDIRHVVPRVEHPLYTTAPLPAQLTRHPKQQQEGKVGDGNDQEPEVQGHVHHHKKRHPSYTLPGPVFPAKTNPDTRRAAATPRPTPTASTPALVASGQQTPSTAATGTSKKAVSQQQVATALRNSALMRVSGMTAAPTTTTTMTTTPPTTTTSMTTTPSATTPQPARPSTAPAPAPASGSAMRARRPRLPTMPTLPTLKEAAQEEEPKRGDLSHQLSTMTLPQTQDATTTTAAATAAATPAYTSRTARPNMDCGEDGVRLRRQRAGSTRAADADATSASAGDRPQGSAGAGGVDTTATRPSTRPPSRPSSKRAGRTRCPVDESELAPAPAASRSSSARSSTAPSRLASVSSSHYPTPGGPTTTDDPSSFLHAKRSKRDSAGGLFPIGNAAVYVQQVDGHASDSDDSTDAF